MSASSFPQTNSEIEMEIQRSSPATTAESSFASSSNATDPLVYDVFINHRGPDTKATFASPLYRRLLSHGLRAFLDEQELEAGFDFPSQIGQAIRAGSVHVAIISPTYTESTWCLKELLLMLESGCPIIPVFYKVSPAELRHGNPLHALEMKTNPDPETGMPRPRYDSVTIENWRNALSIVADKSGFDLKGKFHGEEIRMLDELVESVLKRVKKTKWYVAKYPTGLDEKVEDFEREVLKQPQHSGKVQVLGIVAMGGMGKTTLAVEFFNRKNSDYNKSYCLLDVRENARKSSLHSLQSKVLKGLTEPDVNVNIENTHQGTGILKRYLRDCHVLLILDDVDHEDQLDAFLPVKDVLRFNSLVLITSRDRGVLRKSGVEESSIYMLERPHGTRESYFVLKVYGTVFQALWREGSQAPIELRELEISGKLSKIPKSIGQLTHLEGIFFSDVSFQKLPEEFCQMRCLRVLGFERCYKLKALPDSFGNLTNLEHIELSGCKSLQRLPESFGRLKNLLGMVLSDCFRLERLPESFGNLTNLQSMELSSGLTLERLPESLSNLTNLQQMKLCGCIRLQWLPESLGNLTNLQQMDLSVCWSLESLPRLKALVSLKELTAISCSKLKSIPDLAHLTRLESLNVYRCIELEELDGVEQCMSLLNFDASHCPKLKLSEGVVNKLPQRKVEGIF